MRLVLETQRVPKWGALEDFIGTFIVSRNFGTNGEVGASVQQESNDRNAGIFVLSRRMKNRGLPADTRMVDRRARIDVCSQVEQELGCLQVLVIRRHVQQRGTFRVNMRPPVDSEMSSGNGAR